MLPIRLRSLRKLFGSTVAVDCVDLDIPAGTLFFLLGPSGCGKTTLLRLLAGFIEPDAGSIHFGEREVTAVAPNHRRTGMVFQSYALWPHMTVAQNVAFGLQARKVAKPDITRRVEQALDRVQMAALRGRKPNELSGGQQQRVALARALVVEPDVLLLDEPLSNLDAKLRLEMRSTIRQVCKDANLTAVYVTHDQKEALSMADQMAVMRAGNVIQIGAPRELYHRPNSRFVADFLGETNFIPATVVGREGDELVLDCPAGKLRAGVFPPDLSGGDKVHCSIRPEAISLVDGSTTAPPSNTFVAKRIESVYLGETAQHQLRLPGEVLMKVFELNPRFVTDDNGESQVRLRFDPRDVVVLRD